MLPLILSLGANLGEREVCLKKAVDSLADVFGPVALSPVYETTPMYVLEQPLFLNLVLLGRSAWPPLRILRYAKALECRLGRRPSVPQGPRTLDVDLLYYGGMCFSSPRLTLPHPLLRERAFVLLPLSQVTPWWRDPLTHKTIAELAKEVSHEGCRLRGALNEGGTN